MGRGHRQSAGQLNSYRGRRTNVITRLWAAKASQPGSRDYLDHFHNVVLPELRKLEGYAGSTVLTRVTNGDVEIMVATLWHSLQAIQQFAATDLEWAVARATPLFFSQSRSAVPATSTLR